MIPIGGALELTAGTGSETVLGATGRIEACARGRAFEGSDEGTSGGLDPDDPSPRPTAVTGWGNVVTGCCCSISCFSF